MLRKIIISLVLVFAVGGLAALAKAEEKAKTAEELQQEVDMLKKRIAELEAKQKSPTSREPVWPVPSVQAPDMMGELGRIQEKMDRLLQDSLEKDKNLAQGMFSTNMSFQNKINMEETKEGYKITVDMGDMDEKDLNVDIQPGSITLKGQNTEEKKTEEPRSETAIRSYNSFVQRIALPPDADFSQVKTDKQDKTLVIFVPKLKNP